MTETDTTEPGAGAAPPVPPLPPADPGTSFAPAPDHDPSTCPHIQTAVDMVVMRPQGQKIEHALTHAADWVSRNAPALYTLAQATQILRDVFRRPR